MLQIADINLESKVNLKMLKNYVRFARNENSS